VLGTPNNPTGSVIKRAEADRVLKALPPRALLVIDEAYNEYAAAWPEVDHVDGLTFAKLDRRIIVLRTFSKIYGLAGLRVGYAVADAAVINTVGRVGRTFHVSTPAMVAAIAALDDQEHVELSAKHARTSIERIRALEHGTQVTLYPSLANFVLIDCGTPSAPVYDKLLRMGVIVRPMAAWGLPNCIRVSVPAHPDLPRVIGALEEVLA
jgi:histidinol-phosphate aminotransferase